MLTGLPAEVELQVQLMQVPEHLQPAQQQQTPPAEKLDQHQVQIMPVPEHLQPAAQKQPKPADTAGQQLRFKGTSAVTGTVLCS